ncbi:MAG: alpha/beta hydrolase [Gammaproteobacteria bacterium]|nr:MAG: alpha/beta hydrolase [Gammaproteobacteria bacterium]
MNTIKINGFNCRYELSGNLQSSETVIFVNAIASYIESWNPVRQVLEQDYKLLGYDLRGQWFSEVTHDEPYTFALMVEDLNALMEEFGIESAHIVSTSIGGEIAQLFEVTYPHKVKSLSLIATVSEINSLLVHQVVRWREAANFAVEQITVTDNDDEVRRDVGRKFLQTLIPDIYANSFIENNEAMIKEKTAAFQTVCTKDFFQGQVYLCDMFFGLKDKEKLTSILPDIKAPSLVVAGEEDMIKPAKYSKIIADGIPNSRLKILKEAGHALLIERPDELAGLVKDFVYEHSKELSHAHSSNIHISEKDQSVTDKIKVFY